MKTPIDSIKIENRIRKDYGDIETLSLDIAKNGLLQPIVVTPSNILIAGERRLMAAKKLNWSEIEVVVMEVRDYEHQLHCEIAENESRKDFTPSERTEYAAKLAQVESLKAKERMLLGKRVNDSTPTSPEVGVDNDDHTLPSCEGRVKNKHHGTAAAIIAQKVGMSESGYYRAKKVVESGDQDLINKMDSGELTINAAYREVMKGGIKENPPVPEVDLTGFIRTKPSGEGIDEETGFPTLEALGIKPVREMQSLANQIITDTSITVQSFMLNLGAIVNSEFTLEQLTAAELDQLIGQINETQNWLTKAENNIRKIQEEKS